MKIHTLILGFMIACMTMAFGQNVSARDVRIAAIVNQDAISEADVTDRMRLIMVSSGMPNTQQMRDRLRPQVIDTLIEEQIKLQEAGRNDIQVTDEEVEAGFKTIADQNQFTVEQFEQVMRQQGVPKSALLGQIRAQIAWTKVVTEIIRSQIRVSQNDVAARMKRMTDNVGETEYQLAEIFLPIEDADKKAEIQRLANQLVREMTQQKAPFPAVAAQFSKAPGAAETGGMIGWVQNGRLEDALNDVLPTLKIGEVSRPIESTIGYHILLVRDKRVISADTFPDNDTLTNQIGMERLERAQRRYLSDLKAVAFIDRRG